MNRDQLEGNWKQMKGSVKSKWGELTDDELKEIGGNYEKLVGKLQEKYGIEREEAEREIDQLSLSGSGSSRTR